ncbi:MAG TPA: hypothetical protein VMS22_19595 [Candidatus Eisenbacteria bacterium]|nr:hypothetical protein [Candidatus Eisenbacteria bacterium]
MKRNVGLGVAFVLAARIVAADPLPPEFGGGEIPATKDVLKSESAVAKNLDKFAAALAKCYAAGIKAIFAGLPDPGPDCIATASTKYDTTSAKLVPPPCVDQAGLRGAVQADFAFTVNRGLFCAGSVALPNAYGFLTRVPPDADTLKAESAAAKNLAKLTAALAKCYEKGVANVVAARDSALTACADKARLKYDTQAGKLLPPTCLDQSAIADGVAARARDYDASEFCD